MTNLDSILKNRDITLPKKVHLVKAMFFSSSHVWIWELDYKESWGPKNWCFWTVVLEKTLESPLDCKEIHPVNPKGNQSWIFIGRADAEAGAPVLWPPDAKNWLIGKDPDAGKDWRQEEKGTTEDEMVGWCHRFYGMSLSKLRELMMDREAWHATVHEVAKNRTQPCNWSELFPVCFSSLITKMSVFNLVISCLTISNLSWFMDLTFRLPIQYCSLQHQTLLSPPSIFTTECRFHLA